PGADWPRHSVAGRIRRARSHDADIATYTDELARAGAMVPVRHQERRVATMGSHRSGSQSLAAAREVHDRCLVLRSLSRTHRGALPRLQLAMGSDVASAAP